jgi:cytochrome oxidase Cu insertion factor (SCO1/SenC/PrrC family)
VLSREERAAAFAAGAPKIPRRSVIALLSACLVLGFGGIVVDHFFSGPDATNAAKTPHGTDPPPLTTGGGTASIGASGSAMMDLRPEGARIAPDFDLLGMSGRSISLSQFRGSVVVLSFFDAACDDICPVLATELRRAHADLGRDAARVVLLTVNSDPLATSVSAAAPAEHAGLPPADRWYFLTGSLHQLDRVWRLYGVTIDVQPAMKRLSHNDVLYFIDPTGHLRARAVPFGDESVTGRFSLSATLEARWGEAIAAEARSLLEPRQ